MKKKAIAVGMVMVFASITMVSFGNADREDEWFIYETAEKVTPTIVSLGQQTVSMDGPVLVTPNSPEEDYLPGVTKDQNGNILVTWTHEISILDADIGFSVSTDGGASWSASVMTIESVQKYANSAFLDTTKHEGGGDFVGIVGSWIDPLGETYGAYRIPDVTDLASMEAGVWEEGGSPGIDYNRIDDDSYYLMTYYDQYSFVMANIYDGNDLDRGLVCHWLSAIEFGSSVENWDAQSKQISGPAQDPDIANVHDTDPATTNNDYFYLVWQRNNPDTGRAEIGYKEVVPLEESDIEYVDNFGFIAASPDFDAAHPEIDANSDRAVVVYMTNENIYGDWDVGVAYTTDRGQSWTTGFVANEPQVDETYPAVYMSGDTVFCAYVKEGNLYLVKSEDGGLTWGDPVQVNDNDGSVVAEENAIDIDSSGIVWTDDRNGDKDIYYAPLPAPIIRVAISGGFGVSATISNDGTEAAENLAWSVDLSGLVFLGAHSEGTIASLAPGASETVGPGLVLGIGPTTITATAGGITQTANGFVLGPMVLGL